MAQPDTLLPDPLDELPLPAPSRSRLTCDFCKCSLAPSGDVLNMSSEAKTMRDLDDAIAVVRRDLAAVRDELTAATQELAQARADLVALDKKKSFLLY